MDDAIFEFGQFAAVPAVGGSHEVASDALQAVDVVAMAAGAFLEALGCVLIATVHAAVTVVVDRAVTDVVLVHKVDNIGNGLGIVGRITIDLDIEDVTATSQLMVGRLDFSLVLGRALIVNRHVVAVGIVDLVGHAGDFSEVFAVATGKLAAESLGRSGQHAVVVLVALAKLVDTVAHIGHDADAQLLSLVALAMVVSREGDQAFCQTDEADTQRALVDDALDLVIRAELAGTIPQLRHQQGELLGHGGFLILIAGIELARCDFQHVIEFGKEAVDALLLVLDAHALDGESHDIDGRVPSPRCPMPEACCMRPPTAA